MTLGERIRQARDAKGWTRKEFASRVSVDVGSASRYERDLQVPRPSVLTTIAMECEVSREWLAKGVGNMYASHTVAQRADNERILSRLTDREKEVLLKFLDLKWQDRANIRNYLDQRIDMIVARYESKTEEES